MTIDNTVWYPPPPQNTGTPPATGLDNAGSDDGLPGTTDPNEAPTGFWALFANPAFPSPPQPDLSAGKTGFAELFGGVSQANVVAANDPLTEGTDGSTGLEPIFGVSGSIPAVNETKLNPIEESILSNPEWSSVRADQFRALLRGNAAAMAYTDPSLLFIGKKE